MEERVLSHKQLHHILGRGMTMASFKNYIVKIKKEEGFPPQRVLSKRSTGWLFSEVKAWLDSRPISDSSRSPNKKARGRMTPEQRLARAREICRQEAVRMRRQAFDLLRGKQTLDDLTRKQ